MAEFSDLKWSLPFTDMDPSMELMAQFADMNECSMENPNLGLMGFSNESYSPQQHEFSMLFSENLPCLLPECNPKQIVTAQTDELEVIPENSFRNSTAFPSESVITDDKPKGKNELGKGKRGRCNSKDGQKPKEVVHVRARRGQATDSHSLAERVRREKINEKMRCLQELVPGCYKSMGMTVMLDETINYVQSLQKQVEFLSMKLSAASSFYDIDLDLETVATQEALPGVDNVFDAHEEQRLVTEGYGACTSFHSAMPF